MFAYINDENKAVYVSLVPNIRTACELGFEFATKWPSLVEQGWLIFCDDNLVKLGPFRKSVRVNGAVDIGQAIFRPSCPHICPQHKAVE